MLMKADERERTNELWSFAGQTGVGCGRAARLPIRTCGSGDDGRCHFSFLALLRPVLLVPVETRTPARVFVNCSVLFTRVCVCEIKTRNLSRVTRVASPTVVVAHSCQSLGFRFEFNALVIHLHNALERSLLHGCHFPRQIEDVDVLRNGHLQRTQCSAFAVRVACTRTSRFPMQARMVDLPDPFKPTRPYRRPQFISKCVSTRISCP